MEALFWFHPMVWWINARLATREQACDEHVVVRAAEPIAYAEGIAERLPALCGDAAHGRGRRGGADVKARIDAILSAGSACA